MKLFWFIPTQGDGRYLATSQGGRPISYAYLRQVAQAVDNLGFAGALLPTGRACEDAWVVASALIEATKRMKFMVAVRPGLIAPSLAVRMAATFDRLSEGRMLINVVTGGDPVELAGDGIFLNHDARYEVTDEFLHIWRREMEGGEIDFTGKHLQVKGGHLFFPPRQKPYPDLYFGGSSEVGMEIAGKHVDVYLTWGEPPELVAQKVAQAQAIAAKHGRKLRFGIRLHIIVRETTKQAWEAADELIQYVTEDAIALAQKTIARQDSTGQQRMRNLHQGDRRNLEISPNLWAGVGLVRAGAGTALVGDAETVAERIREYAAVGIETFILSGYPHLEEAYRVAELLFPLLPLKHDWPMTNHDAGLVGEVMANQVIPSSPPQTLR